MQGWPGETKISVIIPAFNPQVELLNCIQAIFHFVKEIIVIDDCSSAKEAIVKISEIPKVRVISNPTRKGPAFSRNLGIGESSGEYLLFLDADVKITVAGIEKMVSALASADIAYPSLTYVHWDNKALFRSLERGYPRNSAAFIVKKSSLDKLDQYFDENYFQYSEDTDFFLRSFLLGLSASYVEEAQVLHYKEYHERCSNRYYFELKNLLYAFIKFFPLSQEAKKTLRFPSLKRISLLLLMGILNNNLFDLPVELRFREKINYLLRPDRKISPLAWDNLVSAGRAFFWNIENLSRILVSRKRFNIFLKKTQGKIKSRSGRCAICNRKSLFRYIEKHGRFSIYECIDCCGQFSIPMIPENYNLLYRGQGQSDFTYRPYISYEIDRYCDLSKNTPYLKFILTLCRRYGLKGRLIDIGCSQGAFIHLASERGFAVVGIDPSEDAIRYAREKYKIREAYVCALEDIPYGWKDFDVVVSMEVIEHLKEPRLLLEKAFDLLRPGGHLIMSVPNNRSLEVLFHRRPYVDYPGHHLTRYCGRTLQHLLFDAGFCNIRIFSTPIDRGVIANIIAPNIMSILASEKQIILKKQFLLSGKAKGRGIVKYISSAPSLKKILKSACDCFAFPLGCLLRKRGSFLVAVANKPY